MQASVPKMSFWCAIGSVIAVEMFLACKQISCFKFLPKGYLLEDPSQPGLIEQRRVLVVTEMCQKTVTLSRIDS